MKELINFRIQTALIHEFDEIAANKGLSRTALLNLLISTFCSKEKTRENQKNSTEKNIAIQKTKNTSWEFEPVDMELVFDCDPYDELRL